MAANQNAGADKPVFLLDLGNIFEDEAIEFQQLYTFDVTDADLVQLVDTVFSWKENYEAGSMGNKNSKR